MDFQIESFPKLNTFIISSECEKLIIYDGRKGKIIL